MDTLTVTTSESSNARMSTWQDSLGMVASIGCAIHCAAMPFVIAYLPALGLSFLADEAFHQWMALVCFLIAIGAFIPGIRRHGNWLPISIGAFGLAFITFAAFGLAGECCPSCEAAQLAPTHPTDAHATGVGTECEHWEECETHAHEESVESNIGVPSESSSEKDLLAILAPWMTPFGGLVLVSAHLLNRRFGCSCSCC